MTILTTLFLANSLLSDSLTFRVIVPERVRSGEPVPIVLRVTNTTERPVVLYLQGRPIAFDLIVRSAGGDTIWRRLEGATVTAVLAVKQLKPRGTLEFQDVWNQQSNNGAPVPPGRYFITGELPTDKPAPFRTPPAALTIVP